MKALMLAMLIIVLAGCESVNDTSAARWTCSQDGEWLLSLYPDGQVNFDGDVKKGYYSMTGTRRIWRFPDGSSLQMLPDNRLYSFTGTEGEKVRAFAICTKRGAWQ